MKIDNELVKKVARIARVSLSDEEISEFREDLEEVLNYFSELEKVKLSKVGEKILDVENKFREDKKETCLSRESVFQNTKNEERGFFKGPKIK